LVPGAADVAPPVRTVSYLALRKSSSTVPEESSGFSGIHMTAESGDPQPQGLNPAALSVADAARLLSKAGGGAVTEEMLEADLGAGAPANPDGTINLVHYAAWLIREMAGGE